MAKDRTAILLDTASLLIDLTSTFRDVTKALEELKEYKDDAGGGLGSISAEIEAADSLKHMAPADGELMLDEAISSIQTHLTTATVTGGDTIMQLINQVARPPRRNT